MSSLITNYYGHKIVLIVSDTVVYGTEAVEAFATFTTDITDANAEGPFVGDSDVQTYMLPSSRPLAAEYVIRATLAGAQAAILDDGRQFAGLISAYELVTEERAWAARDI